MSARWKILIYLAPLAILSAWLFNSVTNETGEAGPAGRQGPDYYMVNVHTLSMDVSGQPANRLDARYLAHYSDEDLTELAGPYLTVYRESGLPTYISADEGRVSGGNEIILLQDDVKLWQEDPDGNRKMEVLTSRATIFTETEIAETDRPATLINATTRTETVGLRAHFKDNRLELLNNVQTTILPKVAE